MAEDTAASRRLAPDCASCFGLCCVALPLTASADFPVDKPAGRPCGHLGEDFGCRIHAQLRESGWRGCATFDCFGAGQQVSQVTFGGVSWRRAPETAEQMYAVFPVMLQLHEMLRHLHEAGELAAADRAGLSAGLATARAEVEALTGAAPETLLDLDVAAFRRRVGALLREASAAAREGVRRDRGPLPDRLRPGADLVGIDLRGADLFGADLRSCCLIAADLRDADLRLADLLGADLRDADLRGADLDGALFLTQPQVDSARGDRGTRLPAGVSTPPHWAVNGWT